MKEVIVKHLQNLQQQVITDERSFISDEPVKPKGDGLGHFGLLVRPVK